MPSYTITITRDGPGNEHTTTLRVRTSGDQVILTEVHVRADDGLTKAPIPAIDIELLARALSPAYAPDETDNLGNADIDAAPSGRIAKAGGPRSTARGSRARAAASTATAGRGRAPSVRSRAGSSRGGATEPDSDSRAYRRLPDDFVAVYENVGGATATARFYGVPRHTVQGWLRRLRQEGLLPPAGE
jgi:hypothetical protein